MPFLPLNLFDSLNSKAFLYFLLPKPKIFCSSLQALPTLPQLSTSERKPSFQNDAILPELLANLIQSKNTIIDSKSGVNGAGRVAREANLYTEIAEGTYSYSITHHHHGGFIH